MLKEGIPHSESIPWMMRNLPKIDWEKGKVVIDSFRSSESYEKMKELPYRCILVFCHCPEDELVERIRKRDGLSEKEARELLKDPIEVDNSPYFLKEANLVIEPGTDLIKIAEEIRRRLLKFGEGQVIIGVAGRMGTGKTTFVEFLVKYLSEN